MRSVLLLGLVLAGCAEGEYIPPELPLPQGVPADMPALGRDQFAVLRLKIHG